MSFPIGTPAESSKDIKSTSSTLSTSNNSSNEPDYSNHPFSPTRVPGPEIWHRHMQTLPFGETPFYAQRMSNQIDADLMLPSSAYKMGFARDTRWDLPFSSQRRNAAKSIAAPKDAAEASRREIRGDPPAEPSAEKQISVEKEDEDDSGLESRLLCDGCDKGIFNVHWHCSICNGGDYDLCQECLNEVRGCLVEGHDLIRRFIVDGEVVDDEDEQGEEKEVSTLALRPKVQQGVRDIVPLSVEMPPRGSKKAEK